MRGGPVQEFPGESHQAAGDAAPGGGEPGFAGLGGEQGVRPQGPMATGLVPRPRQEFIDAFDYFDHAEHRRDGDRPRDGAHRRNEDDVFAAGAPSKEKKSGARAAGPIVGPTVPPVPPGKTVPPSRGPERRTRTAKGGLARTLTGVAAAAVTAVLAVAVSGQVAHEQDGKGGAPRAAGGAERPHTDAATRTKSRPAPAPGTVADQAPYEVQMAQKFPMDAKLQASGDFEAVPGHDKAPGRGEVLRYRVDVEKGLGLDGMLFAEAVQKTLNDDRSWAHGGRRTFERVSSGDADFVISLASPGTTAKWCAKSGLDTTQDNVSCDSAATERVVINAYRWAQGAVTYGDDKMHAYRQMLINHEVGHRLGHNHETCPKQGALAPVMMQQTKFLTLDGATCRANAWPHPEG
ncbi:DUF3152 domain-containing protein [Streptomyces varsoviensis]|uniref:DUF3152 domain-containing protein n=1 Tax=Streptomyces varsoviensis TaxID=67373 RepID=UPI0033E8AA1B